jgi:hypothetical protein
MTAEYQMKLIEQFISCERSFVSIFWYQMLRGSLMQQTEDLMF